MSLPPLHSELDIARAACVHAGVPMITSLEGGGVAETVVAVFASKRDELLRRGLFNFTKREATLAAVSPAPATGNTSFANEFNLPGDCLKVWRVDTLEEAQWEVVAGGEGSSVNRLACDLAVPKILYGKRADVPALWAADFRACFEYYLGEAIAEAHARDRGAIARCTVAWQERMPQVIKTDARERARGKTRQRSRFLDVRSAGSVGW